MCVNNKWIKTPYIKHPVLVPCGHCPACQQDKANKLARKIRDSVPKGYITLFVTLTYDNRFVPYIKASDYSDALLALENNESDFVYDFPVYRDYSVRYVRTGSCYTQTKKIIKNDTPIDVLSVDSDYINKTRSLLPRLSKNDNGVGVAYYKDLQDFCKRLRRRLDYQDAKLPLVIYGCSEYGTRTCRPHFHLLVHVPPEAETIVRDTIYKAWPFAADNVAFRSVEVARDAASYVGSYVCKCPSYPRFFDGLKIRQKHSTSKGFGLYNEHFSALSVAQKIDSGNVTYPVAVRNGDALDNVNVQLPEYVINRHFPKFKGFGRLTSDETYELLICPSRISKYARLLNLSLSDLHKIRVSLSNACKRFIDASKGCCKSAYDYAYYYINYYRLRARHVLANWYRHYQDFPRLLNYDNWQDAFQFTKSSYFNRFVVECVEKDYSMLNYDNPNLYPFRVVKTNHLADLFYKKQKQKEVTNFVMHHLYGDIV